MSSQKAATVVEFDMIPHRKFVGRISYNMVYKALMMDNNYMMIQTYDNSGGNGVLEFFEVGLMVCEEIKTVYVTHIVLMMGWEDAPYDDVLDGFEAVDKYANMASNYIMMLRDMFPGYDVRRIDDGTFEERKRKYASLEAAYNRLISSKLPGDVADGIVKSVKPYWMDWHKDITRDQSLNFHEVWGDDYLEEVENITKNEECVKIVLLPKMDCM